MFTQCRGCGEIFTIIVDELVTANAMVRCSSCGAVFNALDTLAEYKSQHKTDLILHENDNSPPLLTHEYKQSIVTESTHKINPDTVNDDILAEVDSGAVFNVRPDFVVENEPVKTSKPIILWVLFTLALIIGLLWQASLAIKNGSLQLPEGKLKQVICAQIKCYTHIQQSNLNKIALVSRSIRQHPGRDNALIITTGIINSDDKAQVFPALQVKMSNLNGEVVAMRRFLPREYTDAETIKVGMLPNILIPITLELQSPGKSAVTFEVGFSPTYGVK
ncbi:hypothetical protein MNBD_GAMMA01-214 [hydrothermal vent metagenome]|uniref:Zinc finger/thioredoxin putative domain-containing protein n=1 Tax=hydrothermal vent metagenome TaxID=652676 RepID=A0A3B0VCZ2_9ZZZZ